MARLLSAHDRVLAGHNIRVVLASPRLAAGEAFEDALDEKGWELVAPPMPMRAIGGVALHEFVVTSDDEHSYAQTAQTMAFAYTVGTGRGVLIPTVSLLDQGEDPGLVDLALQPGRDAANAINEAATRAANAITDLGGRIGAGIGDAADDAGAAARDLAGAARGFSTTMMVLAIGVPAAAAACALAYLVFSAKKAVGK